MAMKTKLFTRNASFHDFSLSNLSEISPHGIFVTL